MRRRYSSVRVPRSGRRQEYRCRRMSRSCITEPKQFAMRRCHRVSLTLTGLRAWRSIIQAPSNVPTAGSRAILGEHRVRGHGACLVAVRRIDTQRDVFAQPGQPDKLGRALDKVRFSTALSSVPKLNDWTAVSRPAAAWIGSPIPNLGQPAWAACPTTKHSRLPMALNNPFARVATRRFNSSSAFPSKAATCKRLHWRSIPMYTMSKASSLSVA
jgi:hypothetical protein